MAQQTLELKLVGDVASIQRALIATSNGSDISTTLNVNDGPPEALVRQVVTAAERGDRFAFKVAADRLGSIEEAQALVRSRGILRMVDRGAVVSVRLREPDTGEARDAGTDVEDTPAGPVMFGHFAVFNTDTEINSYFEGNFVERIAPGAFKKTMRENGTDVRSLFQHGMDPQIGDKPLGAIDVLREDDTGAYYEVPLLDAGYVRDDIMPGLQANLYGASFKFQAMREEFDEDPGITDTNPKGLPVRTLKEVRLYEFGPVTFPAYPDATAGVRNADDKPETPAAAAPATPDAETNQSHLGTARRGTATDVAASRYNLRPQKEGPSWTL